jgi:hypothetical protein
MKRNAKTPKLHIGPDPFNHYLVIDGRLAGSWKPIEKNGAVSVSISLFSRVSRPEREAIHAAAEQYSQFLGKPVNLIGF